MRVRSLLLFGVFVLFLGIPRTARATSEDHEIYIAANQHVYDVWWYGPYPTGAPTAWDVTTLAGAPVAATGGGLAAYFIDSEFFVYYVTSTGRLGLLYYTGSWHYDDLTALAGAPGPLTTTPFVGFKVGATPYVFYQYGTSPCLAEVYGTGSNTWAWDSPSSLAGAPACESGTPLTGFTINSERLLYYSDGSDVHELYNNGAGWVHVNVTQAAGAPAMLSNSALAGFSYGLQSHIYYVAGTGHIYELYENDGSAWSYTDATSVSGAPLSATHSGAPPLISLASYSYNSEYHVLFVTPNVYSYESNPYELFAPVNTENWSYQQVPGYLPTALTPIAGHNNTDSNTEHAFYVLSSGSSCTGFGAEHVYSYAGSTWYNVTCALNAPPVPAGSQLISAHY